MEGELSSHAELEDGHEGEVEAQWQAADTVTRALLALAVSELYLKRVGFYGLGVLFTLLTLLYVTLTSHPYYLPAGGLTVTLVLFHHAHTTLLDHQRLIFEGVQLRPSQRPWRCFYTAELKMLLILATEMCLLLLSSHWLDQDKHTLGGCTLAVLGGLHLFFLRHSWGLYRQLEQFYLQHKP